MPDGHIWHLCQIVFPASRKLGRADGEAGPSSAFPPPITGSLSPQAPQELVGIDPRAVTVTPSEIQPISPHKLIPLQFEAALLVVSIRGIAATHDIGFAVADGTGAGAAQFLERQELLETIAPRESQFFAERSDSRELNVILHGMISRQ